MAKRVLIIDDEEAAAQALAEVCKAMGLVTTIVTKPAEAKSTFLAEPVDLLIIDLFMPGTDGFAVGRNIRATQYGAKTPIIAVSGVLRQASVVREVRSVLNGEFVRKPFDVPELQSMIARLLGLARDEAPAAREPGVRKERCVVPRRVQQVRAFESDLRADPVYRIFKRLYEERASGHLELSRGQARRRITFFQGRVRFAASNLKQENIGAMQVARGELTEDAFDSAVRAARERRMSVAESLIARGAMSPESAAKALAEQVKAVAIGALGWADGTARFQPDPEGAGRTPEHSYHPLEIVLLGISRHYQAGTLRAFLQTNSDKRVSRTQLMERELFTLKKSTPGEQVIAAIDGKRALGELLAGAKDDELPLLFALIGTGLVTFDATGPAASVAGKRSQSDASRPSSPFASRAGGVSSASPALMKASCGSAEQSTPSIAEPGEELSSADREARTRILAEHQRIETATHYEVLKIPADADAGTISNAYREAASTWHVDRFATISLGPTRPLLDAIFSRAGEARSVLSNKSQRAEYDLYLERSAKGLPTDVNVILAAERLFEEGERLLLGGNAKAALEKLEQAVSLNGAEPEYRAWKGYALFRVEGDQAKEQALAALNRSAAESPESCSPSYLRGMIAFHSGEIDEATRLFNEVIARNPKHAGAIVQLRTIASRTQKKQGLLGRILK